MTATIEADNKEATATPTPPDLPTPIKKSGAKNSESKNSDKVIKLPENEFAYFNEILKNPLGDGNYEISIDAPKNAFAGRNTPKSLGQTVKKKLIERKIIEPVRAGGAQKRAIVKVLHSNVEMSNQGRGRKVNKGTATSKKISVSKKQGGTKRSTRSERAEPGTRQKRNGLNPIFSKMRDSYEDLNEFQQELEKIQQDYPSSFANFLKTLRT
jgi:hypothetical protein